MPGQSDLHKAYQPGASGLTTRKACVGVYQWCYRHMLPDRGAVLHQSNRKWVVDVYSDNLAILQPQQQALAPSWTPNHFDVSAYKARLPCGHQL